MLCVWYLRVKDCTKEIVVELNEETDLEIKPEVSVYNDVESRKEEMIALITLEPPMDTAPHRFM